MLFHIQNKPTWTGNKKFRKCQHSRLTKKQVKAKECLSPKSDVFEALQNIVLEKKTLDDLPYFAKFCHTGVLEVYHSLYNKWAPKRQHFLYAGMLTKSQLAIMDFNEGSNLEQAKTEKGEKRYNVQFSKVTKNWSSKPVKKEKNRSYLHQMIKETIECASKNECLERPVITNLPKNIASVPKPEKSLFIQNQISRFGKTI